MFTGILLHFGFFSIAAMHLSPVLPSIRIPFSTSSQVLPSATRHSLHLRHTTKRCILVCLHLSCVHHAEPFLKRWSAKDCLGRHLDVPLRGHPQRHRTSANVLTSLRRALADLQSQWFSHSLCVSPLVIFLLLLWRRRRRQRSPHQDGPHSQPAPLTLQRTEHA